MAAPNDVTRSTPAGIQLRDGFSTKVAFDADPDVSFWEKSVTAPALDGGDAIDTTTMFNAEVRTMAARALYSLDEMQLTALYDPNVYNNIIALINVETSVTVTFPDGSQLSFWGYLRRFEPAELVEGTAPEATVTIQPTNYDPVNDVEAIPVLTEVAGT